MSFCTDFSDPGNPKILPPLEGAVDRYGHGTHVSGTIAAVGNNGIDVAGVAWSVQIMALKFLCNEDGSGTTGDAIRAMEYAVNKGAHILNNSWGGAPPDIALETAIRETNARGLLFIASAGNNGRDQAVAPNYPAAFQIDNVVAVAASDAQDALATFSNWSPRMVPLAAPGVNILSTLPAGKLGALNGTSMAAPHVSGCAALIKSLDLNRRAMGSEKAPARSGRPHPRPSG
jgi:subtilisin family serine protease